MRAPERRGQWLLHPPWALPTLLLALAVRGTADTPTYPWRDTATQEWLTCAQCPPGTFVKRPCRRGQPTTCDACPPRHYTQFWNYLERCRYCNVICGEHEEEARACGATHNRACRCRPGFFTHAGFCLEHQRCPPGAGAPPAGTRSASPAPLVPSQPAARALRSAALTATARPWALPSTCRAPLPGTPCAPAARASRSAPAVPESQISQKGFSHVSPVSTPSSLSRLTRGPLLPPSRPPRRPDPS